MSEVNNENNAKIMMFPQDSVILKEGEDSSDMFKILRGNV